MHERVSDCKSSFLTVPDISCHDRRIPRHSEQEALGPRSSSSSSQRFPSPSRSHSPSPSRSLTPSISGSPYIRSHSAYGALRPWSSTHTLDHRETDHTFYSHHHARHASSSRLSIHHQRSDDGTLTDLNNEVAEHVHDIALPIDNAADDLHCVTPMTVEDAKYDPPRLSQTQIEEMTIETIPAFDFDFLDESFTVPGWTRYIAPEGNVYYHHKLRRVLTLSDMTNNDVSAWIEGKIERLLNYATTACPRPIPSDVDLVLDYQSKGYYLAYWEKQSIFWLDEVKAEVITRRERTPISRSHLNCRIRAEFCGVVFGQAFLTRRRRHVTMFPNSYAVGEESTKELKAIMTFGYADVISSETTTFPYESKTLRHIVHLADKLECNEQWSSYYTGVVARYLLLLNDERFLHLYGEPYARLSRADSIFEDAKTPKSKFFKISTRLLFYLPSLYYTELHKVYVDRTVHYNTWRRFITELKEDWQNSVTPATVILSTNIGFLAIQSLDNLNTYSRTLAQIASYTSALLSLSDLIVVHILVRRHRQHVFDTAARGLQFMSSREDMLGLEWLAITMSLPGGLFIWSMITFLMSLEFIIYHHSTLSTMIPLSMITVLLTVVVSSILIINHLSDSECTYVKLAFLRRITSWSFKKEHDFLDEAEDKTTFEGSSRSYKETIVRYFRRQHRLNLGGSQLPTPGLQ